MPRIEQVVPIAAPADAPGERQVHPAPGGAWTLVLRDPYDVRTGLAWAAELWFEGRDVSPQHRPALGPPGEKRFRAPENLRPWAPDGRTLALLRGHRPAEIYHPHERSLLELPPAPDDPFTVQWAPTLDRLLVATNSGGDLYDASGVYRGTARWSKAPGESLHTGWTRWGSLFLVTRNADGGTEIVFYDGANGRLTGSLPLDPLELVPYDAARYAAVLRTRYSLVLSPSSRCVGSQLDRWDRVRHDVETDDLLLATYRPVGDPYVEQGHLVCKAERHWVKVTLAG